MPETRTKPSRAVPKQSVGGAVLSHFLLDTLAVVDPLFKRTKDAMRRQNGLRREHVSESSIGEHGGSIASSASLHLCSLKRGKRFIVERTSKTPLRTDQQARHSDVGVSNDRNYFSGLRFSVHDVHAEHASRSSIN